MTSWRKILNIMHSLNKFILGSSEVLSASLKQKAVNNFFQPLLLFNVSLKLKLESKNNIITSLTMLQNQIDFIINMLTDHTNYLMICSVNKYCS